jgi:NADH-quinone oxidoreductase subunit F
VAEFRVLLSDIDIPDIELWETYVANGGYEAAEIALRRRAAGEVLDLIDQSGLQDRGGDWYPVGAQWRNHAGKRGGKRVEFLVVGGNESEPGTFRDRKLLERNPHQILEGIIIAAYALRASTVYVCLRSDMKRGRVLLEQAIAAAREHGWLGTNIRQTGYALEVFVHPGGDTYVETEATALLRSIEGFRAEPRAAAVAPQLFDKPAEVANIGTLAYLPHIVNNGAEWFRGIGSQSYPGTLVFCLSGHVSRPGLYELQLGASTLREVIYEMGGGVRPGHQLKAVLPGGGRSPVLHPDQLDVPLDPAAWLHPAGGEFPGVFGTGGIIVMDETTCMVDVALNLAGFYARQSCGECTPCREGMPWMRDIIARVEAGEGSAADLEKLSELGTKMGPLMDSSAPMLCGLGPAFAWPLQGFLKAFASEFSQHIDSRGCPVHKDLEIKVPEAVSVRF